MLHIYIWYIYIHLGNLLDISRVFRVLNLPAPWSMTAVEPSMIVRTNTRAVRPGLETRSTETAQSSAWNMTCFKLVVGGWLNPSERYESQVEWLFPTYGKIQVMFQTTNQQKIFRLPGKASRNYGSNHHFYGKKNHENFDWAMFKFANCKGLPEGNFWPAYFDIP